VFEVMNVWPSIMERYHDGTEIAVAFNVVEEDEGDLA
jgi:hypothetical protein